MAENTIGVRRAGDSDLPVLMTLIEQFCRADNHDFDVQRVTAALRPLLFDDRYGQVWLVCDGSPAVGYAVITWGWSLESGGRECLLDEIYVAQQGRGLGSHLLATVIGAARAAGARVMFLETEAPNEQARRFYEQHGFTTENSVWLSRELP